MERIFSKRIAVRIAAFAALAAVLLIGAGAAGYNIVSRYKNNLEGKYQMSLNNLADYTANIKTTLEKSIYANTSAARQPAFAKLMSMSEGAKAALSQLPMSSGQANAIQKYFAQVGDYSYYILSKLAKNQDISDSERKTIKTLYRYASDLDMAVGDMAAAYADGSVDLGRPITLNGNIEQLSDSSELTLDGGFREMNEGFTDYPTMIYDGPFSDHIANRKPVFLQGKPQISEEQARGVAANFLRTERGRLVFEGETKGNLPTYNYSVGDEYITVTKYGGYIDIYRSNEAAAQQKFNSEDAIRKAKRLLLDMYQEDFTESYYSISENICTINLAYTKDDIVYYNDLIKVSVSLETGGVVGLCTTGYLMSHTQRNIQPPKISEAEAAQMLSPELKVKSCKKAMIPTGGLNETAAYEFSCEAGNEQLLVYINCETGLEEQIYIVMTGENGVLVM